MFPCVPSAAALDGSCQVSERGERSESRRRKRIMREEEKCSKGGRAEQIHYSVWFCYCGSEKLIQRTLKADPHFKKFGLWKSASPRLLSVFICF